MSLRPGAEGLAPGTFAVGVHGAEAEPVFHSGGQIGDDTPGRHAGFVVPPRGLVLRPDLNHEGAAAQGTFPFQLHLAFVVAGRGGERHGHAGHTHGMFAGLQRQAGSGHRAGIAIRIHGHQAAGIGGLLAEGAELLIAAGDGFLEAHPEALHLVKTASGGGGGVVQLGETHLGAKVGGQAVDVAGVLLADREQFQGGAVI